MAFRRWTELVEGASDEVGCAWSPPHLPAAVSDVGHPARTTALPGSAGSIPGPLAAKRVSEQFSRVRGQTNEFRSS